LAFHSGREADHSPPSSAEVKEWVELYFRSPNTPSWHGAQGEHRDNFTFYLYSNEFRPNITQRGRISWNYHDMILIDHGIFYILFNVSVRNHSFYTKNII
jgi:hypothetical protein